MSSVEEGVPNVGFDPRRPGRDPADDGSGNANACGTCTGGKVCYGNYRRDFPS